MPAPPQRPRAAASHRLDPFDLHLFAVVAAAGSITAGARELHLSLTAASQRLHKLEHQLGATLLHRSKRGVLATDAGHTLLRHAGRLQREMETLHAEMAAHAHGMRATVRVLCNTAAMVEHLPRRIGGFLHAHPDIDIDLHEADSQEVLHALHHDRADLGIVADHVATDGLQVEPFCDDPLVALWPAGHTMLKGLPRPSARRPLHFASLVQQPFAGLPADSGLSRFLQHQAMALGRALHHRVRVRSLEAVVGLVADGAGVAVLPAATAQRLLPAAQTRVSCQPLADAWARRRLLLCRAGGDSAGPATRALAGWLTRPPAGIVLERGG